MRILKGKIPKEHIPFSKIIKQLMNSKGEWVSLTSDDPDDLETIKNELPEQLDREFLIAEQNIMFDLDRKHILQFEETSERRLAIRLVPVPEVRLKMQLEYAEQRLYVVLEEKEDLKALYEATLSQKASTAAEIELDHQHSIEQYEKLVDQLSKTLDARNEAITRYRNDILTLVRKPWYVRLFYSENDIPSDLR